MEFQQFLPRQPLLIWRQHYVEISCRLAQQLRRSDNLPDQLALEFRVGRIGRCAVTCRLTGKADPLHLQQHTARKQSPLRSLVAADAQFALELTQTVLRDAHPVGLRALFRTRWRRCTGTIENRLQSEQPEMVQFIHDLNFLAQRSDVPSAMGAELHNSAPDTSIRRT